MKISYQWIKELLPSLKASPEAIARKLTDAGLEVEELTPPPSWSSGVVVAQVAKVEKHPNADRLSLCRVTDSRQTYSVVCGASNVREGKKYPCAKVGTVFPDGTTIKKAPIRGVESEGMLCSAKELGLEDESKGILELEEGLTLGKLFAHSLGLNDTILEVAITPNRGDCLSHEGIARELSALLNLKLSTEEKLCLKGSYNIKDYVKVHIKDSRGCARYISRVIRGLRITASPLWLKTRLGLLGVRPINNVVDATNYVMLQTGHPLHAFDHRFIRGGEIIVRKAGGDGAFQTLDGQKRKLERDDLVIADAEGPIALAGIMGGADSEIRADTNRVVLEAASFDPVRIRKTGKRLGLQSESSYRFERGVPPATVRRALDHLTSLIVELAGGEPSREVIDVYPRRPKTKSLVFRKSRLHSIVGCDIPRHEVEKILKVLGLAPTATQGGWKVRIPPHRFDLVREVDLVEEVVRLYDIDKIPSTLPSFQMKMVDESAESRLEEGIREFFAGHGFFETIHNSFYNANGGHQPGKELLTLANPLSVEAGALRPTLLSGLLDAVTRAAKGGQDSFRFFELGSIFFAPDREEKRLAGIYGGSLLEKNWQRKKLDADFFYGKGVIDQLCRRGGLTKVQLKAGAKEEVFHPQQSLTLLMEGKVLGSFGRLHPALMRDQEVKCALYTFDLDYPLLASNWRKMEKSYKVRSPFPPIVRDLALIAEKSLSHEEIMETIRCSDVPWLSQVKLFDRYEGSPVPENKKSLAYSLIYENPERTLTDEEVNKIHFDLVEQLKKRLGIELR